MYDITYRCGHTGKVNIIGPVKLRDGKAEWYATRLCPECYAAEREAARKAELEAATARSKENDLPDLHGSEKQVAWGLQIRDGFVSGIEKAYTQKDISDAGKLLLSALMTGNLAHDSAKWWIDHRGGALLDLDMLDANFLFPLSDYFGIDQKKTAKTGDIFAVLAQTDIASMSEEEIYRLLVAISRGEESKRGQTAITSEELEIEAEAKAARIIRPEEPKSESVAYIERTSTRDNVRGIEIITVSTPERDDKIARLLKKMGFAWDRAWRREYKKGDSTVIDRIVEIAVTVLSQGYIVSLPEAWMTEKVISADYKPLNTRRVRIRDGETFAISWSWDDGDFYGAAKRIPGAKWNREVGEVLVPSTSFAKVLDFAEKMKFEVSERAAALAQKAQLIRDKTLAGMTFISEDQAFRMLEQLAATCNAPDED
jgi:hypothetical protein